MIKMTEAQQEAYDNPRVKVVDHPLVLHKLSILRQKQIPLVIFRELLREITLLLAYECLGDLPLEEYEIETPLTKTTGYRADTESVTIVPILRAGLAFEEPLLQLLPAAKVGHLGMYRDETTHKPVVYFDKMPKDIENQRIFIVDPMLATGGSINMAVDYMREKGVKSEITLLVLVACPEGIKAVLEHDDNVRVVTAYIDERLNDNCYIVPGLGDCGDRIFGTE